jgi:RecA/RadA recombinase
MLSAKQVVEVEVHVVMVQDHHALVVEQAEVIVLNYFLFLLQQLTHIQSVVVVEHQELVEQLHLLLVEQYSLLMVAVAVAVDMVMAVMVKVLPMEILTYLVLVDAQGEMLM